MEEKDFVTIAILAKDKAHLLPLYLQYIEKQTYPAHKIKLYIRTNNNNDQTATVLKEWVEKVKDRYSEIYFNDQDVEENVQDFKPHEWNCQRFKVLGKIRQESIDWAKEKGTHYFVVDCDNFIVPYTLENMVNTHLPVVAPLLTNGDDPISMYANYHYDVDENGYYKGSDYYGPILYRAVKGLIEVKVVHCTYFIQHQFLDQVSYDDDSGRYEYVIFSDQLRKQKIPQYLDNRNFYGKLTFSNAQDEFQVSNFIF